MHASTTTELRIAAAIRRATWHVKAARVELALERLKQCLKANFDPNQPRVPRGHSDGGQWTDDPRWTGGRQTPVRLAAADKKPLGRAGRIGIVLEIANRLIDAFRNENLLFDFFGKRVGTVAITSLDDKYIYGFNSGISEFSGQYTKEDETIASRLRSRMLAKYPNVMSLRNIGQMPNDALYHAEVTVLLRAARENGGTLAGKNLIVVVDGRICPSCEILLPYVGRELGNPTVTFVDASGRARTMRNGDWDD